MTHLYAFAARAASAHVFIQSWRPLALVLLLALLLPSRAQATVYYADAARTDNTGTGLSWATAKRNLQDAISLAANDGDEVWVKAGTYLPTAVPTGASSSGGTTVRDRCFYLLTADIKFYGGFNGTETDAAQRDPAANLTILSGDLDGTGGTNDAYHVLLTSGRTSACVVDGFTVLAGRANGSNNITLPLGSVLRSYGGGMYNRSSVPAVSNCTFSGNLATYGGGMYNVSSSSGSSLAVSNCTFANNTATSTTVSSQGGGMYSTTVAPTVSRCTFSANTADFGGGIYLFNCGTGSAVSNCTFSGNSATYGGGALGTSSNNMAVSSCAFVDNSASNGGGMFATGTGLATVSNCVFSGNSATDSGGGLASSNTSSPTVRSCTFSDNSVTGTSSLGAGLYFSSTSGGNVTNCVLYQNKAPNNAAAATNGQEELTRSVASNSPTLTVSNSIVRDYTAAAFSAMAITPSNVYTAAPGYVDAATPAGPDGVWRTADDGLRLACNSYAVNLGTGTTPSTDLLGNARRNALDLGAYEAVGGHTALGAIPTATSTVVGMQTGASLPYTDCLNQLLQINAAGPYTLRGSTTATVYVQATAPSFNRQPYVRRFYDITPAAGAATATAQVTLYFRQSDFDNYNLARTGRPSLPTSVADAEGYAANLRLTQFHGTSATGAPGTYTGWAGAGPAKVFITPTAVTYNNGAGRWEVTFPVTGFSGFFAHTATAPLPVELAQFTATAEGRSAVRLAWATASEKDSRAFEVERSADGAAFARVGEVAAAGTSTGPRAYGLLDAQLPAGASVLYYRLKLVDADGTFAYSPVRPVSLAGAAVGLALYPNPTRSAATLTGAAPGAAVRVLDALGRPVATATADASGVAPLVLPAVLPAGVYVVRCGGNALRLTVE